MPEYHMGVPSWGDGSRSWSISETVPLEGTSWKHQVHEADEPAGRALGIVRNAVSLDQRGQDAGSQLMHMSLGFTCVQCHGRVSRGRVARVLRPCQIAGHDSECSARPNTP